MISTIEQFDLCGRHDESEEQMIDYLATSTIGRIGGYFISKWRTRAAEAGHFAAAAQMRKHGIPLDMARLILFGRAKSFTEAAKERTHQNYEIGRILVVDHECLLAMAERQYFGFAVH